MISRKKQIKIQAIVNRLQECDESYYNNGKSIISDYEYDQLKDELKELDPNNSQLLKIGIPVSKVTEWKKSKHKIAMGSLNKCNTEEEFRKWCNDIGCEEFIIMDKLDGSSIGLEYDNHLDVVSLKKAITRGNGEIGDDICNNVAKMKNVLNTFN